MRARFRFEKLTVWQEARALNRTIYGLTETFPDHELYAMTSQLRRASVSVSANIAEGAGRNSDKDFAHFLEQAYASLMEVASLLYLSLDESYVTENEMSPPLDQLEKLGRQIAALNRALPVKSSKTPFAHNVKSPALDLGPSALD